MALAGGSGGAVASVVGFVCSSSSFAISNFVSSVAVPSLSRCRSTSGAGVTTGFSCATFVVVVVEDAATKAGMGNLLASGED